jgi:hypothetical protein
MEVEDYSQRPDGEKPLHRIEPRDLGGVGDPEVKRDLCVQLGHIAGASSSVASPSSLQQHRKKQSHHDTPSADQKQTPAKMD